MASRELTPASIGATFAATVGLTVSVSAIINTSFGVFLVPLTKAFGWSRTQVALGNTAYAWTMAVLFVLVAGRLMDRIGVRKIVLPSIVLLTVVLVALGYQTGALWQFYALFVVIGICGASSGPVPYSKVVAGWFHRQRGVMLAVTALGATAAGMLIPQYARWLIAHYGWRGGYFGLAAWVLIAGLPIGLLFLRESPVVLAAREAARLGGSAADEALGDDAKAARRTRAFVLCMGAIVLTMGVATGIGQHAVALLTDRGLSMVAAVAFVSGQAAGAALCRLVEGVVLDHAKSPKLAVPFVAMSLVGLLLLHHSSGTLAYGAAALLLGAGLTGETALLPYFLTRFFGLRGLAENYGWLWAGAAIASGIGPVVLGAVYDATGTYDAALWGCEAAVILGGVCFMLLPPYRYPARLPAFEAETAA